MRSVFLFLVGLCTLGALNACGNKASEEPRHDSVVTRREPPVENVHMEPSGLPNGELFKIQYTKRGVDSILAMPEASKLATPRSAAEFNLTMPPKLTVPPHLMPAKDIKVVEETDSTAIVTFAVEHNPTSGRMMLKRVTDGKSSVWLVETVTAMHSMN